MSYVISPTLLGSSSILMVSRMAPKVNNYFTSTLSGAGLGGVESRSPGIHGSKYSSIVSEVEKDDFDHEEWDLDDAQEDFRETYGEDSEALAKALQQIPRRPKRRHRGFIRAYAPDLLDCGIDQQTFMTFLDELDKSTAWSPILDIINLSTLATIAIPGGIGAAVSLPIQLATGIYKELQGRKGFDIPSSQNDFLQRMNDGLFRPRGLYCLIVAHSDGSGKQLTQDNIAANIVSRMEPKTEFGERFRDNFRNADGKFGPVEFPASAELVFPVLDGIVGNNAEGVAKSRFARAMERYGARRDRKGTAKWIRKNPNSPLQALMDPNAAEQAREKGMKKPKKRRLAKNILYMMIVNMPSVEEMAQALHAAGEIKDLQKSS
ncbi:hypothetical protein O1611_g3760 [Lasiodiplodia mahajangana]|uniref:Uncharacterized protein n=1 Tax=Lasiodiplodia mahajangana TaxID=1108764 RepID=A0ACC2JRA8_9PEZI|nr:hypothetical protein O1611_g3760 [Lasiodiplodia mahajangana]